MNKDVYKFRVHTKSSILSSAPVKYSKINYALSYLYYRFTDNAETGDLEDIFYGSCFLFSTFRGNHTCTKIESSKYPVFINPEVIQYTPS